MEPIEPFQAIDSFAPLNPIQPISDFGPRATVQLALGILEIVGSSAIEPTEQHAG